MCVCVCVCVCVCWGQGKDKTEERFLQIISCFKKKRLYLARLRGLVNMYFVKQTAIAMGTREICKEVKGKKKKTERLSNVILSSADSKNSFFSCLLQVLLLHIPVF